MRGGFKNHRLLPTGNHYDRMEGFEGFDGERFIREKGVAGVDLVEAAKGWHAHLQTVAYLGEG